jgi:hypothetical protein
MGGTCWEPIVKLLCDIGTAVGTLLIAALAIWGEKWRAVLAPPKIELRLHTPRGAQALVTLHGANNPGGGKPAKYYHLKAVNVGWLTVQNCRVLLTGISKRGADDKYAPIAFPVPFPFIWSGEEPGPEAVTITTERVFDFGCLMEGGNVYQPRLRAAPNNFDGAVRRGEAVRYEVVVDASNYGSRTPHIFEVNWDGEYPVVSVAEGPPIAPWS